VEEDMMENAGRRPLTDVVLVRHAQSQWNLEGRFTGWADPPLTAHGRAEAERAGRLLADRYGAFARVYSSRLQRARETAEILARRVGTPGREIREDWRLNERHYGALQGIDKAVKAAEVGDAQVWRWRRGYLDRPPEMDPGNPGHPARQTQWTDLERGVLPSAESLAEVRSRVMGFWDDEIAPLLGRGGPVLIASHGNTLRALLMALDGMGVDEVERFEIPTAAPIRYRLARDGRPLGWHYLARADAA
jgi:2,3-bisphosphoglycerate-dependent phosphoglycerate mutase